MILNFFLFMTHPIQLFRSAHFFKRTGSLTERILCWGTVTAKQIQDFELRECNKKESINTDSCIIVCIHWYCTTNDLPGKVKGKTANTKMFIQNPFKTWPENSISKNAKARSISTLTVGSNWEEAAVCSTILIQRKKGKFASWCRPAFPSTPPDFYLYHT